MKRLIYTSLILLLFSFSVIAQDEDGKEEIKCPDILITGPASAVQPGETQTFILTIKGGNVDEDKIKINWEIDRGTIIEGQGTKTLVVKTDDDETVTVTANVDAGGECVTSISESGIPFCGVPPMLVDEFGNIPNGDMKARLDAYFVELQNNPDATGYIVNYGSQRQIATREKFIRNQINFRRFETDRIVFVNGGTEKEIRTRLWVVPDGADDSMID